MLLLLLSACTPVSTIERSPGSREAVCDGLDDDGDGWVDEGVFTVEAANRGGDRGAGGILYTNPFDDHLLLAEGIRTVSRWTDDGALVEQEDYDTAGRLTFSGELLQSDGLQHQTVTLYQYGEFGTTYQEWRSESRPLGGVFTVDRTWEQVTVWSVDGAQRESTTYRDGEWNITTQYSYDELGRETQYKGNTLSDCYERLTVWDDTRYSATQIVDEYCIGERWIDDVRHYTPTWKLLSSSDRESVYTWEDDRLLRYETPYVLWENRYIGDQLVGTTEWDDGTLFRDTNVVFDPDGLPAVLHHLFSDGTGGYHQSMQEFSFDAAGDLLELVQWSVTAETETSTVFVYDSHRNLKSSHAGGVGTIYSFDCHPAQ